MPRDAQNRKQRHQKRMMLMRWPCMNLFAWEPWYLARNLSSLLVVTFGEHDMRTSTTCYRTLFQLDHFSSHRNIVNDQGKWLWYIQNLILPQRKKGHRGSAYLLINMYLCIYYKLILRKFYLMILDFVNLIVNSPFSVKTSVKQVTVSEFVFDKKYPSVWGSRQRQHIIAHITGLFFCLFISNWAYTWRVNILNY